MLLVRQFRRCKRNGVRIPWIWNHEGGAQDRIGDVEDLWIAGKTLYARMSVLDRRQVARFGSRPGDLVRHEVSVEVTDNFVDGAGRRYPLALTHIACVLHPVVPSQGPFRRLTLSAKETPMTKEQTKSEENPASEKSTETHDADNATELAVAEVVQLMNDYFAAGISDDVNTVKELRLVLKTIGGDELESDAGTESFVDSSSPKESADSPLVASLRRQLTETRKQLAVTIDSRRNEQRTIYLAELDRLVSENRITPASRKEIAAVADKTRVYSLSLLTPYRSLPSNALPNSRRASLGANGSSSQSNEHADASRQRLLTGMGL